LAKEFQCEDTSVTMALITPVIIQTKMSFIWYSRKEHKYS